MKVKDQPRTTILELCENVLNYHWRQTMVLVIRWQSEVERSTWDTVKGTLTQLPEKKWNWNATWLDLLQFLSLLLASFKPPSLTGSLRWSGAGMNFSNHPFFYRCLCTVRKLTNEELPKPAAQTRENPKRANRPEGRTVKDEVPDLKDMQIALDILIEVCMIFYLI